MARVLAELVAKGLLVRGAEYAEPCAVQRPESERRAYNMGAADCLTDITLSADRQRCVGRATAAESQLGAAQCKAEYQCGVEREYTDLAQVVRRCGVNPRKLVAAARVARHTPRCRP